MVATITEKQAKAWERRHEYFHPNNAYHLVIDQAQVSGYFNTRDGEGRDHIDFKYSLENNQPHPDSPSIFANGWICPLYTNDPLWTSVPFFAHPNDLAEWIKEHFGY